jgi:hypothetical protein
MAYFILNPNETNKTNVYKIAADDDAKAKLLLSSDHISVDVSDSEFNNLRNNTKIITGHNGSNYTYDDNPATSSDSPEDSDSVPSIHETAAQLRSELDGIVAVCNSFLESNSGHAWYSSIETYRNYCRDFDESSITYPLTKSWEKYCEDNSTTYYHPLQIP